MSCPYGKKGGGDSNRLHAASFGTSGHRGGTGVGGMPNMNKDVGSEARLPGMCCSSALGHHVAQGE